MSKNEAKPGPNFIRSIINEDIKNNKWNGHIATRFPPEPNGFLHIGHAKAIHINFGIARDYNSACHLRFDDTNPCAEEQEYVDSIKEDIKWLGFDWGIHLYHTSDYFDKIFDLAVELIQKNKAFVCSLSPEALRESRGSLTEPGTNSPDRDRPIEENLKLFMQMKEGKFKDGELLLRAKIDMSHPNMNMRDPAIYRIRHVKHHRTGDKWCIYPTYDFAHGYSDAFEKITHSCCSLEFKDHRPLYDWLLDNADAGYHPQQIEFARLNLDYMVTSKRVLRTLIEDKHVSGWDDPRMPTIRGMRRRGVTPEAIKNFVEQVGVTTKNSNIDIATFEWAVRDDLNEKAPRALAVLEPLKVVITNYPESEEQVISVKNHPTNEDMGRRDILFTNEIFIEQSDFMEDPPKKYFRLSPGQSVRLKYAYVITCNEVIKDSEGKVIELRCSMNKDTLGGVTPEGMKKVKGIINWVSAKKNAPAEMRVYDRLFTVENPLGQEGKEFTEFLNPESLKVFPHVYLELSLKDAQKGQAFQFERLGYFVADEVDHVPNKKLIFNRTMTLKDNWENTKN